MGETPVDSAGSNLTLMFVGDLILDEPNPDLFFDLVRDALRTADVLVGHVEVPHTARGVESTSDVPAPPSDPRNLEALHRAHFDVVTMAGNHTYDAGPQGVEDTMAALRKQGIATTGAGASLSEARKPAMLERKGIRLGFLSYNCVGPRRSWATANKPGCAFVQVLTHYELDHATPGGPPRIYSFAEPETLEAMQNDIEQVRSRVDILAVALHKGIGHTPAVLAMYERQVAKAAVDSGADIVIGHHAHIGRGMEVYKSKPVFHGLGNFVTVTRALSLEANPSPERLNWARRRRELFGFEPDPATPSYPFHPESRNTMIGVCRVDPGGVREAGFIPCWINSRGQPEPQSLESERGKCVVDYLHAITQKASLNAQFRADGDWIRFL